MSVIARGQVNDGVLESFCPRFAILGVVWTRWQDVVVHGLPREGFLKQVFYRSGRWLRDDERCR